MSAPQDNETIYSRGSKIVKPNGEDWRKTVLHVCRTGEKEQFYTLYITHIVKESKSRFHYSRCWFQKNLSLKLDKALDCAVNYTQTVNVCINSDEVEVKYHEEPRFVYQEMDAFGAKFKMAKKRTVWWANATSEFWDEWKQRKQQIKDAGYWVKRVDGGKWLVFKRIEDIEKVWESD
jgi:hypothetical protein